MLLGGLQKTTLIDFPGRVACTVFTVGCNFRCPFCHNKDLVSLELFKKTKLQPISEDYFFEFLEKRKKILDGVCITGGEPSLQKDLPQFCKKIKSLGLEVKLDTNGSNPKMLEKLIKKETIDFISMDVKTVFEEYKKAIGIQYPVSSIKESIKLILRSGLEYEFRTTIVPGIHDKGTMVKLAKDLKEIVKLNYVFQQFRPKNCLDPKYLKMRPFSSQEMQDILKSVQRILPNTKLR